MPDNYRLIRNTGDVTLLTGSRGEALAEARALLGGGKCETYNLHPHAALVVKQDEDGNDTDLTVLVREVEPS